MTQSVDRVKQVQRLKAEKVRSDKYYKKEKAVYIEIIEMIKILT